MSDNQEKANENENGCTTIHYKGVEIKTNNKLVETCIDLINSPGFRNVLALLAIGGFLKFLSRN